MRVTNTSGAAGNTAIYCEKKPLARLRKETLGSRIWKHRYLYILMIPGLLYLFIFKYWPIAWLGISFKDYKVFSGFFNSEWVGLKHYIEFFQAREFTMILKNTVLISLYSLIFEFPMPIIFALMLNEVRNEKFKKCIQTVSYLPHFLSVVVVVSMVSNMLSPTNGVINKMITALGGDPIFFMGRSEWFRTVYIGSGIWQNLGWSAIIYLAALSGIDPTLYEAAIVDGASKWQRMINITLPSITGTIIIMFILKTGTVMNVGFEKVFLMGNDTTRQVSEVIATYVYKKGILDSSYSFATAVGLFNSVVNFGLIIIVNKISSKVSETSLW